MDGNVPEYVILDDAAHQKGWELEGTRAHKFSRRGILYLVQWRSMWVNEEDLAKALRLREIYWKGFSDVILDHQDRARRRQSASKASVLKGSAHASKKGRKKVIGYCHEHRICLPLLYA